MNSSVCFSINIPTWLKNTCPVSLLVAAYKISPEKIPTNNGYDKKAWLTCSVGYDKYKVSTAFLLLHETATRISFVLIQDN